MEKLKKSRIIEGLIIGIGVIIFLLAVLWTGMEIGERRANFRGQFGRGFESNFTGMHQGMRVKLFGVDPASAHGAVGEIINLELPRVVVSGPDNLEKTVLVNASTTVRRFQENVGPEELKIGDFIVAIGSPNENAEIEAKLVRIMPEPDETFNMQFWR